MIIGKALIVPAIQLVKADKILNNNTWEVIKEVSDRKQGQNFWAIGDCKQITMNGKVSDGLTLTNYTAWVYIIGFNHNAEKEGNGIAFQGFKVADKGKDVCLVDSAYGDTHTSGIWLSMNNSETNTGGWEACLMRKNVMPLIKASFPADLQAVIKSSTIFTASSNGNVALTATQDEVFLLAEYEIFGTHHNASTQEPNYLKQYSYYSAGNSKVMYKHEDISTAAYWWERSLNASNTIGFCGVYTDGSAVGYRANFSSGVAPCFKV